MCWVLSVLYTTSNDFNFENVVSLKYIFYFIKYIHLFNKFKNIIFKSLSTYYVLVCLQALGSQSREYRDSRTLPLRNS